MRGWDLNPRPSGYEPDELPDCSTPQKMAPGHRGLNRLLGQAKPTLEYSESGTRLDKPGRSPGGVILRSLGGLPTNPTVEDGDEGG